MADQVITAQKLIDADKDATSLDAFINGADSATVTTRKLRTYPSLAKAVKQVMETGGFEPFAAEVQLLASVPTIAKKAAKALDTKKVWLWDGAKWNDTGFSEFDLATQYTDAFSSLTKNSTVRYPFSTIKRNNVAESITGGHDAFLKKFILDAVVSGAKTNEYYRIQQISIPTQEITPNRWIFEILDRKDFDIKNTVKKTLTTVFPIAANQGIKTFTVQDGDLFISLTVDTDNIPAGNLFSVTPENNSYTYIIDPSCYQYSSVGLDNIEQINQNISKLNRNVQLQNLLHDLRNPIQSVQINLIGDSITWGLGASGIGVTTPNDKLLTDARNNATSRTWANILRDYLGTAFCTSARFGDDTIINDGSGYYTVSGVSVLSAQLENFKFSNSTSGVNFTTQNINSLVAYSASASYGSYIDLISPTYTSAASTRPTNIDFDFTGDSFKINFAKLAFGTAETAKINVLVNDVLHQSFSTYASAAAFDQVQEITELPSGKNKISIVNASTDSAVILRISAILATKKITVINNGLSGSSTKTWLDNNIIKDAITAKDNYVFVQLGTNDRHQTAKIGTYRKQFLDVLNQIKATNPNVQITIMSPPAVTQNEDPATTVYRFRIVDINSTLQQIAQEKGYSFISNFEPTNKLKTLGESFLSDELHPNDYGYSVIFDHIANKIINA